MSLPHVVIVGAGFGGLYAAKALDGAPVRVTLVDRTNHHVFQPLLYQVATAGLSAIDVAEPIRRILRRQANATVLLGEVTGADIRSRRVCLASGTSLGYDYLVLAPGAGHSYFGRDDWAVHAPGLKSIEEALEMRRRILVAFEEAEADVAPEDRRRYLSFVVIGGGPTGSELAGAIAELANHTLVADFRRIRPQDARIVLLEAGDRLLPSYSARSSSAAQRQLESLGVEVRTGTRVVGIDARGVDTTAGRIDASTVLWAAGVAASPLVAALGLPLDRSGRVLVEDDLSIPGHPDVFVIGDAAAVPRGEGWVPGIAPAAMQMGRHAAAAIVSRLDGGRVAPFRYVDKGSMATLGRSSAVAEIRQVRLSGFAAWVAWLSVHIFFLIGFRNRVVVLFEWAKAYLTYGRSARLILHGDRRWGTG